MSQIVISVAIMSNVSEREPLSTKDIVSLFGGPSALADALGGIGQTAVSNWSRQNGGGVPGKWHLPLLALAEERGVDLTPGDLLSTTRRR